MVGWTWTDFARSAGYGQTARRQQGHVLRPGRVDHGVTIRVCSEGRPHPSPTAAGATSPFARRLYISRNAPQRAGPGRVLQLERSALASTSWSRCAQRVTENMLADLLEGVVGRRADAEAHAQDAFLPWRQALQNTAHGIAQVGLDRSVQRLDGVFVLDQVAEMAAMANWNRGSVRRASQSSASSYPQVVANIRNRGIAGSVWITVAKSSQSRIQPGSVSAMPRRRSASRNTTRSPSDEITPPSKPAVTFLHRTAGRSSGRRVSSVPAAWRFPFRRRKTY